MPTHPWACPCSFNCHETQCSDHLHATPRAALAVDHLPALLRLHPAPKSNRPGPLDLADLVWVMHGCSFNSFKTLQTLVGQTFLSAAGAFLSRHFPISPRSPAPSHTPGSHGRPSPAPQSGTLRPQALRS